MTKVKKACKHVKKETFGVKAYGQECPVCRAPVTYELDIVGEIRGTLQLPTMKFSVSRISMRPVNSEGDEED